MSFGTIGQESEFEKSIKKMIEETDFSKIKGHGQKIDLSVNPSVPEERRLEMKILKNANILPRELQLIKKIKEHYQELKKTDDPKKKESLKKEIAYMQIDLDIQLK